MKKQLEGIESSTKPRFPEQNYCEFQRFGPINLLIIKLLR